jgi:hypothetical protein
LGRSRTLAVVALAVGTAVGGCGPEAGNRPSPGEPGAAFEQTFGPTYPDRPGPGRAARIERAALAPDGSSLTIAFAGGGSSYVASNPCSSDYAPWVAPNGDELDAEVFEVRHADQATLGPNMACAGVGHLWTFTLLLAQPFHGTTVNDVGGGGTLLVGALPDTAHVVVMPPGWRLQAAFQLDAGPPPTWVEIDAVAAVDPRPGEGPGQLVLYQSFGLSPEWTDNRAEKSRERGGVPQPVTFRGAPATVWVDDASGELLLAWDAGGRSYGLIGNAEDMTVAQLVTYAESVAIPAGPTPSG